MLWARLQRWLCRRVALFLTRHNLRPAWRVWLIHRLHDLHERLMKGPRRPPR